MKVRRATPLPVVQPLPGPSQSVSERHRISIRQVDAFTDVPLTGNPAGVVIEGAGLTDEQMQTIASEMALSETAFVLPSTSPQADLRLRWFTPKTEVPLCGHATIGAFHALAEDGLAGMRNPGTYNLQVETLSGILPVTVRKKGEAIDVLFGMPVPQFTRAGQYKLDIMRILNISLEEFENRLPLVAASYLYVPIRRLHSIFSMKPNFFAMSQFLSNRNLIGLCVFTTETIERTSAFHSRFFAPTIGINEDPVTGSANGPLGVYLYEHGSLEEQGGRVTVTGEQGDVLGRKGRVNVELSVKGGQVASLRIGGRAVTILKGEMLVG